MANNKETLGGITNDFDNLDLASIGFDWDLEPNEIETSGPIKRFAVGFKRGFKDSLMPSTFIAKTIRSALPDSYSRTISTLGAVSDVSKNIAEELKRTNTADLEIIAKQIDKALPHLRGRTSEKFYGKIENRLSKLKQELRDIRHAQMRSSDNTVNQDDLLMKEMLGDLTSTQMEIAKSQEEQEQIRFQHERTERAVRDKLSNARFNVLHRDIVDVSGLLQKQVAYQEQITYKFQRKTLEASYRSLFMLRDIRKLSEMSIEVNKKAYDALIHNTALPDHQKATDSARVKFNLQDSFANSLSGKIAESLPTFLANFYPSIIQNVTRGLQGALSQIGGGLSGSSLFDLMGENKAGGIGGMAGGFVSDKVQRELSAALAVKLKPFLGKLSDKLGGQHHRLGYILQNAPALLREYTTDLNQSFGWRGNIQEMIRSLVPSFYQKTEIAGGAYNTLDGQVGFNQLTQRSIVEVIPGYLSRILHEVRVLRTGDDGIEREVYDLTSGRFTGYSEAKRSLLNRLILPQTQRNVNSLLDEIISGIDNSGSLSDEAKEALRERLLRDALTGGRLDPGKYASGGYKSNTAETTLNELNSLFRGQYALDEQGRMKNTPENYKRLNQVSELFNNLQNISPGIREEIARLSGAGSQELIRDLGFLRSEYGRDYLNTDTLYSRLSNNRGPDSEQGNQVKDLFSDPRAKDVVIKAKDITSGKLIDEESGKRIYSLNDITGPVRDELGRIVLTAGEVSQEFYDKTGASVKFKNVLDKFKDGGKRILLGLKNTGGNIYHTLMSLTNKMGDLYVKGKDTAVMLARDIRLGNYIDVNTQKIIRSVSDITGEVVDLSGNVILTAAEFAEGLFDVTGSRASAVWGKVGRYLDITTTPARAVLKMLGRGAMTGIKRVWGAIVGPVDAYISGETKPRIQINLLRSGFYLNADTGKVIRSVEDIKGSVVDINGNLILDADEIPELVTRTGEKHSIARKRGLLYRMTFGLAGKMLRGVGKFTAGYWRKVAKPYYKWLGGKVLPDWITGNKTDSKEFKEMSPTDGILSRILGVLDSRLPGKQQRKGSWQEIFAAREKEKDEVKSETVSKKKEKNPFSAITSTLANLFGLNKDREEESEDGVDINYIDTGDGKSGKGKKGKAPKGKLGRAWAATKRGVGKVLGKGKSLLGHGGRLLMSGLALTGGALSAAGSALASILSAPLVIGTAVVAGAAVGGYMYYKKRQSTKGEFREFRLAQYGVSPKGWSNAGKVLEIEALFEAATSKGPGYPTVDVGRLDLKRIIEISGVDESDEEEVKILTGWIGERFRPIYLAYRGALGSLAPDVLLGEVDDKLPPELGMQLLEAVSFPYSGDTPYLVTPTPFDSWNSFGIDINDIKDYEMQVRAKYSSQRKETKRGIRHVVPLPTKVPPNETQGTINRKFDGNIIDRGFSAKEVIDASVVGYGLSSNTTLIRNVIGSELTELETIRLKAYGSERLLVSEVRSLLTLEEGLSKRVIADPSGQVQFNGSFEDIAMEFGGIFGITTDPSSPMYRTYVTWLRLRFMPVYLNTLSILKRINKNVSLTQSFAVIERGLSLPDKITVANAIIGSDTEYQGSRVSVWSITETPFGVITNPQLLETNAGAYVRLLEQKALSMTMKTPKLNANGDMAVGGNVVTLDTTGRKRGWKAQRGHGSAGGRVVNLRPGVGLGNTVTTFGEGKGGLWQDIPFPKSNKSREAAMETLNAVGSMTGVSPALLATIVSIESSFNYSIKASSSSATGWFQFINGTWDMMVKQYGSKYGFPNDPTRTLRMDPRANALMGAEFTKENYNTLLKGIGRQPTDTDVYIAHFFGATGAVKFLTADPNAIAAQLFPEPAKSNVSIFYSMGGQARTIGEIYQLMDEKVSRHRVGDTGSSDSNRSGVVVEAPPSTEVIKPAGYMEVTNNTRSITKTAAATVNPMMSNVGVNPFVDKPLPKSTSKNVNIQTPPVSTYQNKANAIDKIQQQAVMEVMAVNKGVVDVLEKQLQVQEKMRDYLKDIANSIGVFSDKQTAKTPTNPTREIAAGRTPPPVVMRK